MTLSKLTTDIQHVQALNDLPNANTGLTADQVKLAFDQAGMDIKEYLNTTLTTEVDTTLTLRDSNLNTHKSSGDHDGRYYTETEIDTQVGLLETKADLTTNRKLSATGDFTGTLNGYPIVAADPGLSSTVSALSADVLQRGINVMYPPIPYVAAKFDGVSNDSVVVQAMITALAAAGGGKLILPANATSLLNINIVGNNITIVGGGNSTILKPYGLTTPVLKIGDGSTQTYNTTLSSFRLQGDALTTTSDGLVIDGATYVNGIDIVSLNFGRHNFSAVSTGTEPTQYINLVGISSKRALGSCLNLNYGTKWVTAIYVTGSYIEGRNLTGSTAVDLTGIVEVSIANTWIQCGGSKQGHVRFNSSNSYIRASNLSIDVDTASTSTSVEVTSAKSIISNHLTGQFTLNGNVEYADGTKFGGLNVGGAARYHQQLSYPIVANSLVFADTSLAVDVSQALTEANTMTMFNSNGSLFTYIVGTGGGIAQAVIFSGQSGTPATATSTGKRGQMMWDATYIYFCIAANTWSRVARAAAW